MMSGRISLRSQDDQESGNHLTEGSQKSANHQESCCTQGIKKYARYSFIALPVVVFIITICDVIYITKLNYFATIVSSLDINVQTDSNEYHTPMSFHVSLGMQSFFHSMKLNGDKSTYCNLYAHSDKSPKEIITKITVRDDVRFKSKNLLAKNPMHEGDIAFSQTSVETVRMVLENPNLYTLEADCQAKIIIYAYGFVPIPVKVDLIMDDKTEIKVSIYGTSYDVWQGPNSFSSQHLSNNTTAPSGIPSPASSKPHTHSQEAAHLIQSIVSFYGLSNSAILAQNASPKFSATLLPFKLVPFPV
jgi:hypothetical protein